MPYTSTFDEPTEREKGILRHESHHCWASISTIVVTSFLGGCVALGGLLYWLGGKIGNGYDIIGLWIGVGLGLLILVYSITSFVSFDRKRRSLGILDRRNMKIEILDIRPIAVERIALLNDNEPIFCFQIDDDTLLYMQGQFLYDPHTYGISMPETDPEEDCMSVTGKSGKDSFPNTHFIIRRLPHVGRVTSIALLGEEMTYSDEKDVLKPEYDFSDCCILKGSLLHLSEALERASKSAQTGPVT